MFAAAGQWEPWVNLVFLAGTGWVAWHGIRYRDAEGNPDLIRLFFGSIAALFFCLEIFSTLRGQF